MKLVRNVDNELIKQALIKGMCEFASLTNTFIIAEGIETQGELEKLIEFDIAYGQGYFIQRPAYNIQPIKNETLNIIQNTNRIKNRFFGTRVYDFFIKNISKSSTVVSPDLSSSQLENILRNEPSLPGVCVIEEGKPIGIITKSWFYKQLSSQFGRSLFLEKSIRAIMNKNFLSVDCKNTIDIVAKKAMSRCDDTIYDFITIISDGQYFGIVTVKDVLEKSIELEVANAKSLNPLSELPGNTAIEMQLERIISLETHSYVLYFDIDNFKAYNDYYGFEHGDRVLRALTRIIKEHSVQADFVGHIGGDDFIVIVKQEFGEEICSAVITQFSHVISQFYTREDVENGYITIKNRKGVEENFPLMTLTIVGVYSRWYSNLYNLAEQAGKLKKQCKQQAGNKFFLECAV